jgi:hypothetical protein
LKISDENDLKEDSAGTSRKIVYLKEKMVAE